MKKYDIITTQKSWEVESNSMLSTMTSVYKELTKGEELLAIVREDFNSGKDQEDEN